MRTKGGGLGGGRETRSIRRRFGNSSVFGNSFGIGRLFQSVVRHCRCVNTTTTRAPTAAAFRRRRTCALHSSARVFRPVVAPRRPWFGRPRRRRDPGGEPGVLRARASRGSIGRPARASRARDRRRGSAAVLASGWGARARPRAAARRSSRPGTRPRPPRGRAASRTRPRSSASPRPRRVHVRHRHQHRHRHRVLRVPESRAALPRRARARGAPPTRRPPRCRPPRASPRDRRRDAGATRGGPRPRPRPRPRSRSPRSR